MDITQRIKEYKSNFNANETEKTIFLDLADEILSDFPYRLNDKTYLLVPDKRKELIEMSHEYAITTGMQIPISLTMNMSNIINKFNEVAKELGFTVITDINQYQNDGQLFDLLGKTLTSKDLVEEEHNYIENVNIPLTLSVDNFIKNQFFPVVFKNATANRGEDKYLIENSEQLNKVLSLLDLSESKSLNLKEEFVVQEYINGFEGINSSIRVLTSSTGDVLSSLFLISTDTAPKSITKKHGLDIQNPCEYLNDYNSEYYLNSRSIISNAAAGGKAIPLNCETASLSANDEIYLSLYGMNPQTLSLPQDIINQCKQVANYYESEKGIVMGIDFIYNSTNDSWYYLEANKNPSVDGYKIFMDLNGYSRKDVKTLMQFDSLTRIVERTVTLNREIENKSTK